MAIEVWTAVLSVVGLGAVASAIYAALDMYFKRGCFSPPLGIKYTLMTAKLVLFPLAYTLAVGGMGYAATSMLEQIGETHTYSFRIGMFGAFVSATTIVFRRVHYENDNWSFFSHTPRPGSMTVSDKSVPKLFGSSLPLSFNNLMDDCEEEAMPRVREKLEDRSFDYAVDLDAALGERATEVLVKDFLLTHIVPNAVSLGDQEVSDITKRLESKINEPGLDSVDKIRYIMGDIRRLGYHDFIRSRRINKIIKRYGTTLE